MKLAPEEPAAGGEQSTVHGEGHSVTTHQGGIRKLFLIHKLLPDYGHGL